MRRADYFIPDDYNSKLDVAHDIYAAGFKAGDRVAVVPVEYLDALERVERGLRDLMAGGDPRMNAERRRGAARALERVEAAR